MAKVPKKQYVVIGLGRFGRALAKALYNGGAEVMAIDKDPDLVNDIDEYCTQAICADATDEKILHKLGVHNLDVAIVCMASEIESSIFVTLILKQLGIPRLIAKANNIKHKHVLEKIGADRVIIPEEEMGVKLAAALLNPNMIEVLSLSDNYRIVEIRTPAKWQHKSLIELNLRAAERITIILLKRGEEIFVPPAGDCVLLPDDILVIAGTVDDTRRLSTKATDEVNQDLV